MARTVKTANTGPEQVTSGRLLTASIYVLVVATIAAVGFVRESTSMILLAAALSLPASAIALPGYYLLYGLLAYVTNANPSGASGSTSCTVGGDCSSSSSGDPAIWFQITTDVLGILALTCAAILNVFVLRRILQRRRGGPGVARETPSSG